jgi:plasmid stabilization system protein ParE
MALKVYWTARAKTGLFKVLDYLEENWTRKEILKLEANIDRTLALILSNPEIFPKSERHKHLYKAIIDKNNYFSYRINILGGRIEITSFRGSKQRKRH